MGGGGSGRAWQAPRCSSLSGWAFRACLGPADAPGAVTKAAMTRASSDTTKAGTNLAVA